MKKQLRYEKSLAIKRQQKEQTKEIKHLKALHDGQDLHAERQRQLANEITGNGRAKHETKWNKILQRANIGTSF